MNLIFFNMKKYIIIAFAFVAFTMVSCDKNKPEEVVEQYFTYFYQGEFDKIQEIVLEEHREYYHLLNDFMKQKGENENTTLNIDVKVSDIQCNSENDTLTICECMVSVLDTTISETAETEKHVLQLKKVDRVWLVDQGKEAPSGGSNENEAQMPTEEEPVPEDMENIESSEETVDNE